MDPSFEIFHRHDSAQIEPANGRKVLLFVNIVTSRSQIVFEHRVKKDN